MAKAELSRPALSLRSPPGQHYYYRHAYNAGYGNDRDRHEDQRLDELQKQLHRTNPAVPLSILAGLVAALNHKVRLAHGRPRHSTEIDGTTMTPAALARALIHNLRGHGLAERLF